jgi:heme A synthase
MLEILLCIILAPIAIGIVLEVLALFVGGAVSIFDGGFYTPPTPEDIEKGKAWLRAIGLFIVLMVLVGLIFSYAPHVSSA